MGVKESRKGWQKEEIVGVEGEKRNTRSGRKKGSWT